MMARVERGALGVLIAFTALAVLGYATIGELVYWRFMRA